MVIGQKAGQGQALDNGSHQVGAGGFALAAVLAEHAAQHKSAVGVHSVKGGLLNGAADIVVVHVYPCGAVFGYC